MAGLPKRRILRARTVLLLVPIALALLAVLIIWCVSPPDPSYNGKRLSSYLYDLQAPAPVPANYWFVSPPSSSLLSPGKTVRYTAVQAGLQDDQIRRRADAREAIAALGPKAIPLLRAWLQSEGSVQQRLRQLASASGSHFRWLLRWPSIGCDQRATALSAIRSSISRYGGPLIPTLREQAASQDDRSSFELSDLIRQILAAIPAEERQSLAKENAAWIDRQLSNPTNRITGCVGYLMGVFLRSDPPNDPEAIIRRLWAFREQPFSNIKGVIQQLDTDGFFQNMIYLESGVSSERPAAALYFRDFPRAPERIVPLLVANLNPSSSINLLENTASALGSYGSNSTTALPLLINLLTCRKGHIAMAASNAIERITSSSMAPPASTNNSPVISDIIRGTVP